MHELGTGSAVEMGFFEVGYEPMDDLHRQFRDLLMALASPDAGDYGATLLDLHEHLLSHCAMEERWMTGSDFPSRACHRQEHEVLLEVVSEVRRRFDAGDVEVVIREVLSKLLPVDFPALFEKERSGWIESMRRLEAAVTAFDPSLKAAVETATGKVIHEGQVLEKKLMQVWKRRHEESVQKIRRARGSLFPKGGLQERSMSILGYEAYHGRPLVEAIREKVTKPGVHVLVPAGD